MRVIYGICHAGLAENIYRRGGTRWGGGPAGGRQVGPVDQGLDPPQSNGAPWVSFAWQGRSCGVRTTECNGRWQHVQQYSF